MPAEPVPGLPVTVESDVPCRMRDGITLYADVYRPAEGGPHPVLLMREPYNKWTAQAGSGYNHPSWWAARGYVTIVQDCRGRYRSEGDFVPFVNEAATATTRSNGRRRCPEPTGASPRTASPIREQPSCSRPPSARRASSRSAPA